MFFGKFSSPWMITLLIWLIADNVSYYLGSPEALWGLILSIPAILIAITFHEYAHALAADKLGDDTPRRQGRLTLNPLKHLDPIGAILLLTAGFGWGKPVEINSNNFNRTVSIKKGNAIVSLAGPAMNFILAIVFSIIYGLLNAFASEFIFTTAGEVINSVIIYTISINVGLGVFNLIPLPPLDGSKIILAFLPSKARVWYMNHEYILYIVFIAIWITPLAGLIISPAIKFINAGLIKLINLIIGLGA